LQAICNLNSRGMTRMKLIYITLDPKRYPRVKKLESTFHKRSNIDFQAMIPRFKIEFKKNKMTRLIFGAINYTLILLQILFVKGDAFWVANCPDILVLPLILRRRKYILDYRSPWSIEVNVELGKGPWVWLSLILENIALKNAKVISVTTSKLLTRTERFQKPSLIIPNYPMKNFQPDAPRKTFRKLQGVPDNAKIILFIGKLARVEGVDLFPGIISDVLKNTENKVVFWIVGDGTLRPLIENIEKKHPNAVRLFGWQPYNKIPNFINASDVCIAPRDETPHSRYYNEENLFKISECGFYRKPIVACGIAPSKYYMLVKKDRMAKGIADAIAGRGIVPEPRTWEDHCEEKVLEAVRLIAE